MCIVYFVDNVVIGLYYICDFLSIKIIGEQGVLCCLDGVIVCFLIGDIELGDVVVNGNIVFIILVDLVDEDVDENNNIVINISCFLISLDVDQDLVNGIQIDFVLYQDLGLVIDFSLDLVVFEIVIVFVLDMFIVDLFGGFYLLVVEVDVQDYVILVLYLINVGFYCGIVCYIVNIMNGMIFLVIREGVVYGSNQFVEGFYMVIGFDESGNWLSIVGNGEDFKIDGSSGVIVFIDIIIVKGWVIGQLVGESYFSFQVFCCLMFDLFYDQDLVQEFVDLLLFVIGIGENCDVFFIIGLVGVGLDGVLFGFFQGGLFL